MFTVLFTPGLFDKETFFVSHLLAEPLINGLVTLVGTTISELIIWRKLKEVILRKGNKLYQNTLTFKYHSKCLIM